MWLFFEYQRFILHDSITYVQKFLCVGRRYKATVDQFTEIFKTDLKRSTKYVANILEALVVSKVTCHLTVGLSGFRVKRLIEVIFRTCVERERANHLFITAVKADSTAEVDAGIFLDNEVDQLAFLLAPQRIKELIKPLVEQRLPCSPEIFNLLDGSPQSGGSS